VSEPGARPRRRRGSRGGRRRRRGGAGAAPASGPEGASAPESSEPALDDGQAAPAAESPSELDADRRRRGRAAHAPSSSLPREIGIDQIPGEDADLDSALLPPDDAPALEPSSGEPAADGFGHKKRRRRGSRGGRNRKRRAPGDAGPDSPAASQPQRAGQGRPPRRGEGPGAGPGRSRRAPARAPAPVFVESIPGEEDDLAELPALAQPAAEPEFEAAPELAPREGGRRRGRRRGRRTRGEGAERAPGAAEALDEELDLPRAVAPVRNQQILVNATDPEERRVAVVEDGQIVDFQMTVRTETSVVNDIYRGRVVNLEPAIGAAFVDFGQGRNGFLHTSDVLSVYGDPNWNLERLLTTRIDPQEWDSNSSQPKVGDELESGENGAEGGEKPRRRERGRSGRSFRARPRLPITDLLKKGQMVCVQVTKDAIGDKGPTLTTYISIPGRYLVLMPSMSRTGVSRKIEDEKERRRLKRILEQMDVPQGMGVIVRTAGVGRSKAELQLDLDYLMGVWETFSKRLRAGHGPAPLYQESDIAIRTVRDLSTPQTEAIIVDDVEVHRQILEFAHKLMPEDESRVHLHTGPKPLFHSFGVEPDFERMFARRIDLPSGGSIVFDQAEALVAIDVNSGRTRTDGFDFEQIALKTNLEAAPVIARQIRLRDLGGIIVVDFIDMMKPGSMRTVERRFREALAQDRARFKIGRISQFGLLELTRQRLGPGIDKKVFHTCSRCRGTGHIRTVESRAAAILRRLGSALTLKGFSTVEVRAHPEVVDYLKSQCSEYLRALEYRCERQIRLLEAGDQVEDSVLRYLRTDGREVRPGGRRKR
jgi:ribonuclease E